MGAPYYITPHLGGGGETLQHGQNTEESLSVINIYRNYLCGPWDAPFQVVPSGVATVGGRDAWGATSLQNSDWPSPVGLPQIEAPENSYSDKGIATQLLSLYEWVFPFKRITVYCIIEKKILLNFTPLQNIAKFPLSPLPTKKISAPPIAPSLLDV